MGGDAVLEFGGSKTNISLAIKHKLSPENCILATDNEWLPSRAEMLLPLRLSSAY